MAAVAAGRAGRRHLQDELFGNGTGNSRNDCGIGIGNHGYLHVGSLDYRLTEPARYEESRIDLVCLHRFVQ